MGGGKDDLAGKVAGYRYLEKFGPLFESLRPCGTEGDKAKNRRLHYDQYASLILLYFFSPALTSLRGLQEISHCAKVQRATGGGRVSLGSLSEAAGVFDPDLLRPILAGLAEKARPVLTGKEAEALRGLTAVDGTFFKCLPRMAWALWRDGHKGVKAHVHFSVLKAVPEAATVTVAASSEVKQLEGTVQAGRLYVPDRGYFCYRLLGRIRAAGSSFIARAQEGVAFTVQQEREVTAEAREAGVVRDVVVKRLGSEHHKDELKGVPVRLVWVDTGEQGEDGEPQVLILCTDRLELEAGLVALGYRYRWWVELFFRWLKCILGCRHLLSHQPDGVAMQIYLALIASVLVSLWTWHKPSKRLFEWLCFYFQGVVSEQELDAFLKRLDRPKVKRQPRYGPGP